MVLSFVVISAPGIIHLRKMDLLKKDSILEEYEKQVDSYVENGTRITCIPPDVVKLREWNKYYGIKSRIKVSKEEEKERFNEEKKHWEGVVLKCRKENSVK